MTADFAKHRGIRRARWIPIVATLFLISQLVGLRVRDIEHLQYAVTLVGISYGGVFGLLPTIIIEWFGMGMYSRSFLSELQELTYPPEPLHRRRIIDSSLLRELGPYFSISACSGEYFLDGLWAGLRCKFIIQRGRDGLPRRSAMLFHEFVRDRLGLLLRVDLGPCGCETGPEVQIAF